MDGGRKVLRNGLSPPSDLFGGTNRYSSFTSFVCSREEFVQKVGGGSEGLYNRAVTPTPYSFREEKV